MNIVIFTHPSFSRSTSMPKFASMIQDGMLAKGHKVEIWRPFPLFFRIPIYSAFKKWLGYIDQYIIFPCVVFFRLFSSPASTVFVFSDQALGPWVPLVKKRPHVVHVHDFMALKSALGEYERNPTKISGRLYQRFIWWGFRQARSFVAVSNKTDSDLTRFMAGKLYKSRVIYNGLNYSFIPISSNVAVEKLLAVGLTGLDRGYIIHVGGNQWYKNRIGVLHIYNAYVGLVANALPLLMIGEPPSDEMIDFVKENRIETKVNFVSGLANELLVNAYSAGSLLLFPSLAEGFGWPIIEAMACGCPVLTTNEPPMNEIGADYAGYIDRMPDDSELIEDWSIKSARAMVEILGAPADVLLSNRAAMLLHAQRFSAEVALDAYEESYRESTGLVHDFSNEMTHQ